MVNKIGTFANIAHTNFNVRLNCGATCPEAISAKTAKPRVKKASFAAFVITRLLNKLSTTIYTCWSISVSNQKSVDFAQKPFGLSLLLESTSLYIQVSHSFWLYACIYMTYRDYYYICISFQGIKGTNVPSAIPGSRQKTNWNNTAFLTRPENPTDAAFVPWNSNIRPLWKGTKRKAGAKSENTGVLCENGKTTLLAASRKNRPSVRLVERTIPIRKAAWRIFRRCMTINNSLCSVMFFLVGSLLAIMSLVIPVMNCARKITYYHQRRFLLLPLILLSYPNLFSLSRWMIIPFSNWNGHSSEIMQFYPFDFLTNAPKL